MQSVILGIKHPHLLRSLRKANSKLNASAFSSNPQSAIRNPQSAIRNPQSAIRNPQSAINYILQIINRVNYTIVSYFFKNPLITLLCDNAVHKFYDGFLYTNKFIGDMVSALRSLRTKGSATKFIAYAM